MRQPNVNGQLTAINSVAVNTTLQSNKVLVQHINSVPHQLLYVDKVMKRDESYLKTKLDEYEAMIGYSSGLTVSDVQTVITRSIQAFAGLVYEHKLQNVRQLKDAEGVNIANAFNRVYTQGTSGFNVTTFSYFQADPVGLNARVENNTYSNAQWVAWVTDITRYIHLPLNILISLEYLYGSYFSNFVNTDDGHSYIIDFKPSVEVGLYVSTNKKFTDDAFSALKNVFESKKLLLKFLQYIGFSNIPAMGFDFTRDLAGNTIRLIQDDKIIEALETNWDLYKGFFTSDSISEEDILTKSEVVYSPLNYYYDPFNYESVVNYTADELTYEMLFASIGTTPALRFDPVLTRATGAALYVIALPRVSVSVPQATLMSLPNEFYNRLMLAVELCQLEPAFDLSYALTFDGTNFTWALSARIQTGYNVMLINKDDFKQVTADKFMALMFDDYTTNFVARSQ